MQIYNFIIICNVFVYSIVSSKMLKSIIFFQHSYFRQCHFYLQHSSSFLLVGTSCEKYVARAHESLALRGSSYRTCNLIYKLVEQGTLPIYIIYIQYKM